MCFDTLVPEGDTVPNCSCFTSVRGASKGHYSCQDMALRYNLSTSTLIKWNKWLGSVENCDLNLFSDLLDNDSKRVCIKTGSKLDPTPTSTTSSTLAPSPTIINPGAPTQAGIVAGCEKYHTVVSGDGCYDMARTYGISLNVFYGWNPAGMS